MTFNAAKLPIVLVFALCLGSATAQAADQRAMSVAAGFASRDLAPHMDYLLDPNGDWSVQQAAEARGWRPLAGFTLKKGRPDAVTWFRLGQASADRRSTLYLEICTHQPKNATVYAPVKGAPGGYIGLKAGWGGGGENDELGFISTVVALPRDLDDSRPLLLRWDDPFITEPRPVLYGQDAFLTMSWNTAALKFAIYGVMAAMILYNLVIALFLRDRTYFMYVLYMFAMLLYQAVVRGEIKIISFNAYQALYPMVLLLSTTTAVLGMQFARTFLTTKINAPRLDKALLLLMALFLTLVAGVDLLGFKPQANTASFLITPLMIPTVLGAACLRIRQGFGAARYFFLAWTVLSLGVLAYLLYGLGYLPSSMLTVHAAGLGAAAESVLLSLALADRIRGLRVDREALLERQRGLAHQAVTDELTGLYNKRYLLGELKESVKRAAQGGQPLSVALFDVDHFKRFNDSFGHPKGDEVLAAMGHDIRGCVRDGDKGCRYGGEEFVVILPMAGLDQALAVAERVRGAIARRRFAVDADQWASVTVSAGVACLRAGENAAELLDRADKALYVAKRAGRDRTVVAE